MAKTRTRARQALILGAMAFTPSTGLAETRAVPAQEFPARILAIHNAERSKLQSAPLVWDGTLAAEAAVYATQMALTGRFEHSDRKARHGVGENLWMGTRDGFSVENMVGAWVAEKRMFVPGVFPAVSRTGNWADVGHYTQMIWATTDRIGCAVASNSSTDFLVCRYAPAGNIDGIPLHSQ
jgi:hypothetical protein